MLTNVLKSLVSRAEFYDPDTGEPLHPLLRETRPEKNVLIIIVTGDRGLAGAFNSNVLKAPLRFVETKDKNIEVVTIGRKGRDFMRAGSPSPTRKARSARAGADRGRIREILAKVDFDEVEEIAEKGFKPVSARRN